MLAGLGQAGIGERATICNAHMRRGSDARRRNFAVGAAAGSVLRSGGLKEDLRMRILQPAEWSKPRGFSHGVEPFFRHASRFPFELRRGDSGGGA